MKAAIMQPYVCPYLGYFQLVGAVDLFVFYDDVNYIRGGWINRNRIMSMGKEFLFTIPIVDASSYRLIKDTEINWKLKEMAKIHTNIRHSYARSPYFKDVFPVVDELFAARHRTISEMAIGSVKKFSEYLGLQTKFKTSSEEGYVKTEDRVQNLVNILEPEHADYYINPIGGQELYKKEDFEPHGITLNFIKGTGSLSIIDVCMQHSREEVREMLKNYTLI